MKKLSVALFSLGLLLMFQGSVTINAQSTPNYVLATDEDFSGTSNGNFRYIGTDEYVEIPHVIKGVPVTSYHRMFEGTSVKGVKSTNTNVTSMSYMFANSQATSLDLSSFDTSNVTNMSYMFYGSQATSLDLSSFDTSNVTDMSYMFSYSKATELDLSSFDTSNVTNMRYMFSYARSLTELDLSSFDTSNVTNMSWMFYNASSLTELDLSNFDTSNVTNMGSMFRGASSLTELDLSSFDTSNVTNMGYMFYNASSLTELDLSNFDTSNVTNMDFMFAGTSSLTKLDLSSFDTSKVTSMYSMFSDASGLTELDLSSFDTSNVTNMGFMFYGASSLTELDLSSFDTSNVTNMSWMFYNARSLTKGYARTQADADRFNASNGKPKHLNFVVKGTPVVTFSENGNSTYKKSHSTKVNVDGSGFSLISMQYAWSTSASTPTSGWDDFSNGQTLSKSTGSGDYYLHIRATSAKNITTNAKTEVFRLDNTAPSLSLTQSPTGYTNNDVTITATGSDSHSGVKRIRLPNGNWVSGSQATYNVSSNGTYTFEVEDHAGNVTKESITINNIDKTLSMEQPVIESFGEIELTESIQTVATDIKPFIVKDWRENQNAWRLDVKAERLKTKDGGFVLPSGMIKLNGLSEVKRIKGVGSLPDVKLTSKKVIDTERVTVAESDNSRGEFEFVFPNNALEITVDPSVVKAGEYKLNISWELVNAP